MTWTLKPISAEAVPAAIEKAQTYRLLNEPSMAASICLDILAIEPDNQHALITMVLALTDQFGRGTTMREAQDAAGRLTGAYERSYYAGIIAERAARWRLAQGAPGARFDAYELIQDAMKHYEEAETLRHPGNDDPLLRWNTCARFLMRHPEIGPRPEEAFEPILSE